MPHRARYLLDGEIIPSVNEVTGLLPAEGLDRWRKRVGIKEAERITKEAKTKGSKLAKAMEIYRLGKTIKSGEFESVCANGWNDWYLKANATMLEVECHLVNTLDRYHGSPDVILSDSGGAIVGDDKAKKRFADYRLLMNEHAYAACDSIEKDGKIVPVPWKPIKRIVFWTYDPDTGEMYPSEHKFDSRVYRDFLTLRNVWDINARAEEYFKEHATLLPSQKRTNVAIAQGSAIPHAKGYVSDEA